MTNDDRESVGGDQEPLSTSDSWHRLRYIMNPETYVDEDSTVSELLWQLYLEQRATRYWLAVICWGLILVPLGITLVVLLTT